MKVKRQNKQRVLARLCLGASCALLFSGVGIGIGYAIWYRSDGFVPPIKTIWDGPEWDLDAYRDFYTWDYAMPNGMSTNNKEWSMALQYNIASYVTAPSDNRFGWRRVNIPPQYGLAPRIEANIPNYVTEGQIISTPYWGFSYVYMKTPKIFADGRIFEDNGPPVITSPSGTLFSVIERDINNWNIVARQHFQKLIMSPSILVPSDFPITANLFTVSHLDGRLANTPTNVIDHSYKLDFTMTNTVPDSTLIKFTLSGKLLNLLNDGIDGGPSALGFKITTVDGTDITNSYTYDDKTYEITANVMQLMNLRKYRLLLVWSHTVAPFV